MRAYDPFSPEALVDPYPFYRELRERGPMYALPQYHAWALPRFDEVWEVLGDAERFSILGGPVFLPGLLSEPVDPEAHDRADPRITFASWDPPRHTAIRSVMSPHFRPGAVGQLEGWMRELARARLDELSRRARFDVVRDYATPISVRVMCRILGLPDRDADQLAAWINESNRREAGRPGATAAANAAHAKQIKYVVAHVAERRDTSPQQTHLIDTLIEADLGDGPLDDRQVGMHASTLLTGGTETMPKLIAGGLLQLERAPAQRAALAADPALAEGAFEEVMRHQGVLQHVGRTALQDVEIRGESVRRGERLFLLIQSANRDEREFSDAESFDIHRRPERHVGLGHGPHHCVGAQVARLEGRVLLGEFVHRIPEYRVDVDACERPGSEFQVGYTSMPIEPSSG